MPGSDAAFAGSIPAIYHARLGPMLFQPFADDLARRLRLQDGHILELACGTGVVTRELALAAPARITATDLNAPMLDYARSWIDLPRIEWRPADAQALPFDDEVFDAAVCQFGVMFFPDRAAAHRETGRVLRPQGRYLFSVWDSLERNPATAAVHAAVAACFPADPPAFLQRTPHGYSDPQRIRDDATAAGFHRVEIETVRCETTASAADLAVGFCQGSPLRIEILAREPDGLRRVTEAVQSALASRFGEAAFTTDLQAYLVTAAKV
jgi:ubiquinone/menaquinone biosynthesis C-methylase UbiE